MSAPFFFRRTKKVTIYEQTEVKDVDLKLSEVRTNGGNIKAEKILIATNGYSSFIKKLDKKQIPIYTYITLTEPLTSEQLNQLGFEKRVGIEDARNLLHYYRLTPDNRLLLGGSDALYYYGGPLDRDRNTDIEKQLQQQIIETFPQLSGIKFTHHWGGAISASLDLVPTIGEQSKRTEFFIVNRKTTYIPPEPIRYGTVNAIRKVLKAGDKK